MEDWGGRTGSFKVQGVCVCVRVRVCVCVCVISPMVLYRGGV